MPIPHRYCEAKGCKTELKERKLFMCTKHYALVPQYIKRAMALYWYDENINLDKNELIKAAIDAVYDYERIQRNA